MSTEYIWGYVFGVAVVLIPVAIGVLIYKLRHKNSGKYDERQELARGKAFKYAFFVQLGYNGLTMVLDQVITPWADRSMEVFVGVVLSAFVYAAICIRKDAYISFQERPQMYVIMFSVIGGVNLLITFMNFAMGNTFIENGLLTFRAANLICALLLLLLAIVLGVKSRRDANEEPERQELE